MNPYRFFEFSGYCAALPEDTAPFQPAGNRISGMEK